MNNNRRNFLQNTSLLATACLLGKPLKTLAETTGNSFLSQRLQLNAVNIMHTANLHGRLNPFALGDMHAVGGLHNVRNVVSNIDVMPLLVDAGGFLNGNGGPAHHANMISMMNKTNYKVATIGNEELLNGEAYLASLVGQMNFALVNCNYSFSNTVLKAKILPYQVVRFGHYKIGVTGVGPLLNSSVHAGITYSQPYKKANEAATYLKNELGCDMVICLSQLGYKEENGQPCNKTLAASSTNIDVIIGGDGKTFVPLQLVLANTKKEQVIISNSGYGGSILGTLHYAFNESRALQGFDCKNYIPGSNNGSAFHDNYIKLTA